MLADLVISVSIAVTVSFMCSLMEAALYAVGAPFVRNLEESGAGSGKILARFKEDIDRPIAAILILNTLANTAGAVIAGAAAERVLGRSNLIWFSAGFTLLILFVGEILPKVIGVTFRRPVSRIAAYPLLVMVYAFTPIIFIARMISSRIKNPDDMAEAPEEEVHAMAHISEEEGSILPIERELIGNALKLNDITASDLMTPRTVIFSRPTDMTLREIDDEIHEWSFARVPIYTGSEPEEIIGVVLRREVFAAMTKGDRERRLRDLAHPVHFVPKTLPGHDLLQEFLKRRNHLFVVIDEYGGIAGVVSLEDVIEFLIGKEIVGELDPAEDMQEYARKSRDEAIARRLVNTGAEPQPHVSDSEAKTDVERNSSFRT